MNNPLKELNKELQAIMETKIIPVGKEVITKPHICESGAGFYIGTWCVENMDGSLFPQPYERLSGYGTAEDMAKQLDIYRAEH